MRFLRQALLTITPHTKKGKGKKKREKRRARKKECQGPYILQIRIQETQPQPTTIMTLFLLLRVILWMATLDIFLAVTDIMFVGKKKKKR